jgi:hypothetical protein
VHWRDNKRTADRIGKWLFLLALGGLIAILAYLIFGLFIRPRVYSVPAVGWFVGVGVNFSLPTPVYCLRLDGMRQEHGTVVG